MLSSLPTDLKETWTARSLPSENRNRNRDSLVEKVLHEFRRRKTVTFWLVTVPVTQLYIDVSIVAARIKGTAEYGIVFTVVRFKRDPYNLIVDPSFYTRFSYGFAYTRTLLGELKK